MPKNVQKALSTTTSIWTLTDLRFSSATILIFASDKCRSLSSGKISGRNSRGFPKSLRIFNSAIALPFKWIDTLETKKTIEATSLIDEVNKL